MHHTQKNLIEIKEKIKDKINNLNLSQYNPKIIAVSKTFSEQDILPLIEYGHAEFGENKVQEAQLKWSKIKEKHNNFKLHMLGKLQTNKVKNAVEIFDYIHSLDNYKLAQKISSQQNKINFKPKIFVQVNIGNEPQKNGISISELDSFIEKCKNDLGLDIIGLMCLPPNDGNAEAYFKEMNSLKEKFNFKELSMGMSSDYNLAIKNGSTFIRIGSKIFGERSK